MLFIQSGKALTVVKLSDLYKQEIPYIYPILMNTLTIEESVSYANKMRERNKNAAIYNKVTYISAQNT